MVKRSIDHKPSCQDLGESSDSAFQEEIETSKGMCQHVGKSVSLADIKRQLKSNRRIGTCDKKVPTPCSAPGEGDETSSTPAAGALLPHGIWLCMQCGHQGCARHATQHFNTPRSDSHALAADTADWAVWCFTCNEKVSLKSNKKLHEAVQFVKKKQGTLRPGATPSKEDSPQPSKSSKNVSAKEKQTQAERDHESLPKVKGLINLGNSCYLNSVLQCLSQCHYLTHYLDISSRSGRKVTVSADGETLDLVLPEGGPITASLCDFLKQMHITGTASTVSPSHLLRKIALKVPQFVGCDQQDAHELLRALMEQARLEDLRRHQRQIMLGLGLPTKADPKEMPDELKARAKALGKQVSHTTIDTIFSGQLVSLVVCQACMARTHRMEPFLDLSLPVAEDKPTRPKKLSCGAGAEEEDGEYVLSPGKNSGRPSKHALKKERKAARRTKKHGPPAAEPDGAKEDPTAADTEKRPTSDSSGQELDRRSDAASAEGESDADEEDNGDTDLMIDSLLPDDPPSGRVSPDPDAPQPAAESEEFLERLRALAVGRGDEPRAAGDELRGDELPCPPQTAPARPASPAEPAAPPAGRVPLVGGDARRCAPVDRADPGGAGDAADGSRPMPDGRPAEGATATAAAQKTTGGATLPVSETLGEKQNCVPAADVSMEESPRGAEESTDAPSAACAGAEAALQNGPLPTASQLNDSAETEQAAAAPATVNMECDTPQDCSTAAAPPDLPAAGGDPAPPSHPDKGGNGDQPPPPSEDVANGDPPLLRRCEWLSRALTTLAPRYQAASGECSILTCLNQYTAPELLAGNNKFGCDNCTELRNQRLTADEAASEKKPGTVYSNASKQLLIYSPPPVLTIHLKRFEVCNFSLRKVNRHVQFGERLDLAPFCSSISEDLPQMRPGQRRVVYSLFGVVEHSGRLTSGHYTAYVRVRRRHDLLTVNPARLTTLVTDAFGVACERARQRAEHSQPPTTPSEATATTAVADTTVIAGAGTGTETTDAAGAGAGAEALDAAGSREPQEPESQGPKPNSEPKPESQEQKTESQEPKPEPQEPQPEPQLKPEPQEPQPQPELKPEPQEPREEPDPEPEPGRWFYVSDTHVTEVTLDKVLKAQAYLLFYERIV